MWRYSLVVVGFLVLFSFTIFWMHTRKNTVPMLNAGNLSYDQLLAQGDRFFNVGETDNPVYDLANVRHYYTAAIERDPYASWYPHYQLARIDFLEGQLSNAIWRFENEIALFKNAPPNMYYMLGLAYGYRARRDKKDEDWQKAEEAFRAYIERRRYEVWPYVDLSWVLFSQGKFEEMLPVAETGTEMYPDNPWILNMYGLALMHAGDMLDARVKFEQALAEVEKLSPEDWGKAYPGNDPRTWEEGLEAMRNAIRENVKLTAP